jgi:negative regulator of flagellin synthesis FlgM
MKIDSPFKPNPASVANRTAPPRANSTPAASTESVNLSAAVAALKGDGKAPIDSARIEEIKAAISEGRFKINPEAIADSLIETARHLISSQRQA